MKGPGHKAKFDVRRTWECPLCGRRHKTSGTTVNLACSCLSEVKSGSQTWMRLIEETPRTAVPPAAQQGES